MALNVHREVSERAQTVITMLPAAPQVRQVYLDASSGLIKGMANLAQTDVDNTLFLDATSRPNSVRSNRSLMAS